MKPHNLIELKNTVPTRVEEFARQLVDHRRLEKTLEAECAALGGNFQSCDSGFAAISDLDAFTDFCGWIDYWVKEFSRRSCASAIQLSLSHSRQPTCPRFHIDNIPLRLIATLYGPGTQWLHAGDVVRGDDCAINQNVDARTIQQMSSNSVGFFYGARSRSAHGGVVHRSPLTTEDRVVVKMDKIS